VTAVVVPRFVAGEGARLRRLDPAVALVHLTSCLFNLAELGNRALAALASLVRRCAVAELIFGDAHEGVAALQRAGLILGGRPGRPGRRAAPRVL
jgi:hypothetical protein